jgi:hypothetical protein
LAQSPQHASLLNTLDRAVSQKPRKLAIVALLTAHKWNKPTKKWEDLIAGHLFEFSAQELSELHISILARIITCPQASNQALFTKTFDLLLELYPKVGSKAAILFKTVNRFALSEAQNKSLEGLDNFDFDLLDHSSLEPLQNQVKFSTEKTKAVELKLESSQSELRRSRTQIDY